MSDYIEREAALAICEKEYKERVKMADWCGDTVARNIAADVSAIPAADVAPVRRGRWIHPHWCNSVSAADCSECGAEAHHIEYRGVQKYYKICPSCGARMDKEDEHEAD